MKHLDAGDILSVASGLRPASDPRLRHLRRCPRCQAAVKAWQVRLNSWQPAGIAVGPLSLRPTPRRPWRAVAALLLIAVAGGWWPKWVWGPAAPWGPPALWTLAAGRSVTLRRVAAPAGVVRLRLSAVSGWALVSYSKLPAPGPGQLYELWWIRGNRHVPAGTIDVPAPSGSIWVYSAAHFAGVGAVGITREPAPGRPQPTGPREYFGPLLKVR